MEPKVIIQKDTVQWRVYFEKYPVSSYDLTYYIQSDKNPLPVTLLGQKQEKDFLMTISNQQTGSMNPGLYQWQAVVHQGVYQLQDGLNPGFFKSETFRKTVRTGEFVVEPSLESKITDFDPRSHVKRTLDNLEAVIEKRATSDQMSYSIGTRSLSRMSYAELLSFRSKYRSLYRQEQRQKAGLSPRKSFTPVLW